MRAGFRTTAKGMGEGKFRPKWMTWNSKYSTTGTLLLFPRCVRPTDWQENMKRSWMAVHYFYQQGECLGSPTGPETVVSETTHILSCYFTHWAPNQATDHIRGNFSQTHPRCKVTHSSLYIVFCFGIISFKFTLPLLGSGGE